MAKEQKSALKVIMGAMTFGEAGNDGARVHDLKDVETILGAFQAHGHNDVDTARTYAGGTSEQYLGKIGWQKRGLNMATKLYPLSSNGHMFRDSEPISHRPEDLCKHLLRSLEALQTNQVDLWYLHAPDHTTPYEITLKAVNDLYKEGYFKRLGISNYSSWEVAEIVKICQENGYIQPTVYQGLYNALHRNVEPELFPCLRKFGISFYAFNPLAGGIFTDRYISPDQELDPGSRFDPKKGQGQMYRERYWNDAYFKALVLIREACGKASLTMTEVAFRWLSHHSLLKQEHGDSILIGGSSLKHIEQNLTDLEKGPLPDEIVETLDKAWLLVKPYAVNYFR